MLLFLYARHSNSVLIISYAINTTKPVANTVNITFAMNATEANKGVNHTKQSKIVKQRTNATTAIIVFLMLYAIML